ncbi:squalene cyclase [Dermacoccaceae bacterium W4C1]
MEPEVALTDWLLGYDPAVAWQVERDLLDAPEARWRATRERVATEGFGPRLLVHQDADGQWAGGAYFPGQGRGQDGEMVTGIDPWGEGEGQPWTATTWSLTALRRWGMPASAMGDTAAKIAANSRWEYESLPYWGGETDVCINAVTLANGAWLGLDMAQLRGWFPAHQLPDGGWNCEWVEGSTRSSFHSTLNALEGMLAYEEIVGGDADLARCRALGEQYLLGRSLLRKASDGQPPFIGITHLMSPNRWYYNVVRVLDYLRAAAQYAGTSPDPRAAEAIGILREQRQPDGTWLRGEPLAGRVWFEEEVPVGEPSPWLTLVGTRVLRWWEEAAPAVG